MPSRLEASSASGSETLRPVVRSTAVTSHSRLHRVPSGDLVQALAGQLRGHRQPELVPDQATKVVEGLHGLLGDPSCSWTRRRSAACARSTKHGLREWGSSARTDCRLSSFTSASGEAAAHILGPFWNIEAGPPVSIAFGSCMASIMVSPHTGGRPLSPCSVCCSKAAIDYRFACNSVIAYQRAALSVSGSSGVVLAQDLGQRVYEP